jgi:hypothetical protein
MAVDVAATREAKMDDVLKSFEVVWHKQQSGLVRLVWVTSSTEHRIETVSFESEAEAKQLQDRYHQILLQQGAAPPQR